MAFVDFKAKAIELVKQAVEQDNAQNYEEALRLYKASLEHFSLHLKYEKNPSAKKTITAKVRRGVSGGKASCAAPWADTLSPVRAGTVHGVPGPGGRAAKVRMWQTCWFVVRCAPEEGMTDGACCGA